MRGGEIYISTSGDILYDYWQGLKRGVSLKGEATSWMSKTLQ